MGANGKRKGCGLQGLYEVIRWRDELYRGVQTYWVTRIFSNPARVHIHQPAQFTVSWHIPVLRREKERERNRHRYKTLSFFVHRKFLPCSVCVSVLCWHIFGSYCRKWGKRRRRRAMICPVKVDKDGAAVVFVTSWFSFPVQKANFLSLHHVQVWLSYFAQFKMAPVSHKLHE